MLSLIEYIKNEFGLLAIDLNDVKLYYSKLKNKFKDCIGLSIYVDNKSINRYIISFNAEINKQTINVNRNVKININAYSIDNVFIDFKAFDVNSMKIIDIKPIKKDELTVEELYKFFNYKANVFDDTKLFQEYYGLMDDTKNNPYFIEDDKLKVKIGHLHEELNEIEKAVENKDLSEFADAIIDLIYVAAGLGALCKLPMHELWNDVQNSNMVGKERVKSLDTATKRKTTFDVRKTKDWIGPRGKEIINYVSHE